MALLARIRTRALLGRTRIGAAVVVHAAGGITTEARVLATALPADPEHELVVADLPCVAEIEVWQSFAAVLPRGRRPVRVVPGRHPREIAPYVWQWLADQTGRAVLAPHGRVHHVAGSLFVHSLAESGWLTFRRGASPSWAGKRFPRPVWDSVELGHVRGAGFRGVAEPLPAGVWLRPDIGDAVLAKNRARLATALPCLPDAPTIVVGARNAADIELADVVAYWRTLPPTIATAARFVRFGGLALPEGEVFGQRLADALDADVCCYTGVPTGSPAALHVSTLREDGSLGWSTYAQAFTYRPRGAGAARLSAYRQPVAGLSEVSPGVYWYAPDVVLEIVQAGLWLRPAEQIADPSGIRTTPLDPAHNQLLYEATDPAKAGRLRAMAEDLVRRLDDPTRLATRLMPTTALPRSGSALSGVTRPRARPVLVAPAPANPAPLPEPRQPTASKPAISTPVVGPAGPVELAETDLPWLSRLMETVSMPMPARPSEVERPR